MKRLKPSRKRLKPGDVFVMQYPDTLYLFGRVIKVDIPEDEAPAPAANLIYVYSERSTDRVPRREVLKPDKLLIPPQHINRLPWSRGYLETVIHWPLEKTDVLPRHCFFDSSTGKHFDDYGRASLEHTEPCGEWGLASYASLDDEISRALGIPRAPD